MVSSAVYRNSLDNVFKLFLQLLNISSNVLVVKLGNLLSILDAAPGIIFRFELSEEIGMLVILGYDLLSSF